MALPYENITTTNPFSAHHHEHQFQYYQSTPTPTHLPELAEHRMKLLISPLSLDSELVLRDVSNGSDPTSRRSRFRSSSVVTNPYEEPTQVEDQSFRHKLRENTNTTARSTRYNKYSPTPSIKRGKAERLLKEHGSPPGIRVTAGGRIVPQMNGPMVSPPYFDSNWQNANYNRANRYGGYAAQSSNFKGLNGYVVDMGNGNLCQIVDGELRPLDWQNNVPVLYMAAPNLPPLHSMAPAPPHFMPGQAQAGVTLPEAAPLPPQNGISPSSENASPEYGNGPNPRQLRVLEQVHAKLEHELKELDRNEVLNRGSLNSLSRADIVRRRIELVNRIDDSRRGIMEAKRLLEASKSQHSMSATVPGQTHVGIGIYNNAQAWLPAPHAPGAPYYMDGPRMAANFAPVPPYNAMPVMPLASMPPGFPDYSAPSSYEGVPMALEERQLNASVKPHNDATEMRASAESKGLGAMGLDGSSAQQPRRSHAIAIKKPTDASVNHGLNPTSPSYEPGHSVAGDFSPSLVAEMNNIVASPRQDPHGYDGAHISESSATTGDFFPHDTQQYSSHKYSVAGSNDSAVNLPAWMANNNANGISQHMANGAMVHDKYAYTDSPELKHESIVHESRPYAPVPGRRPSTNYQKTVSPRHSNERESDLDFISQTEFQPISPATKLQQSAHLRVSTGSGESAITDTDGLHSPTAYVLGKVSEQTAALQAPSKSVAYCEGFKTGLQQAVMAPNSDPDYLVGYRDGMLQSVTALISQPVSAVVRDGPVPSYTGLQQDAFARKPVISQSKPAVSQNASQSSISAASPPGAPQNSTTTTPQRSEKSSGQSFIYSPEAAGDFMSRPNVNISSTGSAGRELRVQTENLTVRNPDPPSPLANRTRSSRSTPHPAKKTVTFTGPQVRTTSFQGKAQASTASTDEHASSLDAAVCLSPRSRNSPIKNVASAAMDMLRSSSYSTRAPGSPEKKAGIRSRLQKKLDGTPRSPPPAEVVDPKRKF